MLCPVVKRFLYLILYADTRWARLLVSITSMSWGVMLLKHPAESVPGGLHLALLTTSQVSILGAVFLFAGISAIVTLLAANTNKIFTLVGEILCATLWTFSTTLVIATVYLTDVNMIPGIGNHTMIAVSAWWVLIRTDFNGK